MNAIKTNGVVRIRKDYSLTRSRPLYHEKHAFKLQSFKVMVKKEGHYFDILRTIPSDTA